MFGLRARSRRVVGGVEAVAAVVGGWWDRKVCSGSDDGSPGSSG